MPREGPNVEPPYVYECVSCGNRTEADRQPGECPECDGKMQNVSRRRGSEVVDRGRPEVVGRGRSE